VVTVVGGIAISPDQVEELSRCFAKGAHQEKIDSVKLVPMKRIGAWVLKLMEGHPLSERRFGRRVYSETDELRLAAADIYARLATDETLGAMLTASEPQGRQG
jgi:hypothetical protein